jgi:hypothetical protein
MNKAYLVDEVGRFETEGLRVVRGRVASDSGNATQKTEIGLDCVLSLVHIVA